MYTKYVHQGCNLNEPLYAIFPEMKEKWKYKVAVKPFLYNDIILQQLSKFST